LSTVLQIALHHDLLIKCLPCLLNIINILPGWLKSERDNDFNDLAASSGGNYDFDNFDEDFI
jgi:hypothetical protein